MLNRQEYKRHTFPGLLGPCPEGFVIESSKETSFVRGRTYELVDNLTDVSRWSKMFPGIIAGVRESNVITSGPLTPQNGLLQEMNVDLWVQSPQAPNRRMKFLRFSRQIEGMWAVVDVSPMDSMRGIEAEGNQIGYMGCRLLPSGCLLEDIDNTGFTKVADQANSNMLVLQETTSDMSCSLVVYSFVEKNMMCAIMDGGDNTSVFLLPSGFSILPDGHSKTTHHVAASASSSSALTGRSSTAGSILTAGYQAILPGSGYKHAIETMDNAGNRVCQAMSQILADIGAQYAVPAD
ncbi:hypothetical protein HU200_007970 [Digitaria exilis]|uniref:START domain-containing protein n=1 Tax=Digitaria exilis TaxID=1010633 RepID=A0A835FP72_9POAL|nr:hypothetical protein HU200_007970 [Digitaria exilis]